MAHRLPPLHELRDTAATSLPPTECEFWYRYAQLQLTFYWNQYFDSSPSIAINSLVYIKMYATRALVADPLNTHAHLTHVMVLAEQLFTAASVGQFVDLLSSYVNSLEICMRQCPVGPTNTGLVLFYEAMLHLHLWYTADQEVNRPTGWYQTARSVIHFQYPRLVQLSLGAVEERLTQAIRLLQTASFRAKHVKCLVLVKMGRYADAADLGRAALSMRRKTRMEEKLARDLLNFVEICSRIVRGR